MDTNIRRPRGILTTRIHCLRPDSILPIKVLITYPYAPLLSMMSVDLPIIYSYMWALYRTQPIFTKE